MTLPAPLNAGRIVPVIVLDSVTDARPLGIALLAGGIALAEVTLRTPAGLAALKEMTAVEGLHVGAGSVLVPSQVDDVVAAGASFVVSPGLSVEVVTRCAELGVPALPGVATSSELMAAVSLGLSGVKFFPAGLLGGPAMITALAAPFPHMSFVPSGGVTAENMDDYLALGAVPAVSGSWMVDPKLIAAGSWDEITARAAEAVKSAASEPAG
jgi:2-dehydro-3-deoxyphosphogluconate aldolase/(4S)-4-hydroxy-2-oxoglutarate aldolase